jgi:hypothetical protein
MGEKATIFQGVQFGIEAIPGSPVAANKKLLSISLAPSVAADKDVFRAAGNKYPSFALATKERFEAGITGRLTYNEILYLLSSLISQPTPVQQGTTTAYKWTFTSNTSGEDAGTTFTVEQGDATSAWRSAGVKITGMEFTFNASEVSFTASAMGQPIETGITMTSSPTSMAQQIVLPTHLKFYVADTRDGLSSAQAISRGFELRWGLTDKNAFVYPVGQSAVMIETEPSLTASLVLAADSVGVALLANMRSATTKWFRITAEGGAIEATYKYTFQIDFPANIDSVSDIGDRDGIFAFTYGLTPVHDASWGKAFQIDVITDVTTL